jgi:hypothetical protein
MAAPVSLQDLQESARRLSRTCNRVMLAVAAWYVASGVTATLTAALHWPHPVYLACEATDITAAALAIAVQRRASLRHRRLSAARRAQRQAELVAFTEEEHDA